MQIDAWHKAAQIELTAAAQDIDRGRLGLDWTTMLAQMGQRPEDYFAAMDLARGASERQDVPIFLRALLENVQPVIGTPQAGGVPFTAASLAERLMGTGPSDRRAEQDQRALDVAEEIFKRGGGSVLPGVMESLYSTEKALLAAAGGKLGFDVPSFFEQHAQSRIGQLGPIAA